MKIIFLDIDGVLVTTRCNVEVIKHKRLEEELHDFFDPVAVEKLNQLIEIMSANVVVSSAWRMVKSASDLAAIFRNGGIRIESVDVTPFGERGSARRGRRGREIQLWLEQNPEVSRYVVVDDCHPVELEGIPYNRCVFTGMDTGLGDGQAYEAALKILSE